MRLIRSALYVPADKPRAIAKARDLPCDAVILDLEDAVAPEARAAARGGISAALQVLAGRFVIIRVNALGSDDGDDDVAAARAARPDALLFPKIAGACEVERAVAAAAPIPAWAMIETPGAVIAAAKIAAAGVGGLVAGWNDLALACGLTVSADRRELWAAMGAVVLAARACGCIALDGVPLALRDPAAVRVESAQARAFGFDGKTLVHPDQIAPCREGFAPSAQERAGAQALLAAWDARPPGAGVIGHDGRLVEALHAKAALRLLALG